jgi:hypothetical protein
MSLRLCVVDPFAAVIGGEINALRTPLWVPWPIPVGWTFGGFAYSGDQNSSATVASWNGPDPFGDPTEMVLVSEEPGGEVGGHFAGLNTNYPAEGVGVGSPHARFMMQGHPVPLWSVDSGGDRAVYVGEAAGRWLWVVVHPEESSAIVVQPITLVDARTLGAELTVMPVGELSPRLALEQQP